jgi:hypothetical protein
MASVGSEALDILEAGYKKVYLLPASAFMLPGLNAIRS